MEYIQCLAKIIFIIMYSNNWIYLLTIIEKMKPLQDMLSGKMEHLMISAGGK